ncbi:MAG: hypothetical protein GC134_07745 [Proteobacteria bacterium]|nr:hypothetical protein [Pseudomonadota bacterium]
MRAFLSTIKNQSGQVGRGTVAVMLVMATLVLLILYSLGFEFIVTTEGTKMMAFMRQIEGANQEFRASVGVWPHVAVAQQTPVDNLMALVDPSYLQSKYQDKSKNYLTEAEVVDGVVRHPFGKGGTIMQMPVEEQGRAYMLIIMTDVPVNTYEDADRREDGSVSWTEGRLQTDEDPGKNSTVTVTYLANQMDAAVAPR